MCVIQSSPQAVFLWFRMQRMCPITGPAHSPVGSMKSPLSSDHQACRAVGWEKLRQMHTDKHTHIIVHINTLYNAVMMFGLYSECGGGLFVFVFFPFTSSFLFNMVP